MSYGASAADLVDGSVPVNCAPASGSTLPIGQTTVSCTAEDSRHNSATQPFTVTVRDTTAPALTLSGPINANAGNAAGAVVTYTVSASDTVDGSVPVVCAPASGSTFPIGTTTVDCSVKDTAGNTALGSFTVTVHDVTAPQLTLPSPIIASATGPGGATVSYTASANDAVDGPVDITCTPASGSTFPIRATTVNCNAHDAAGNSASDSFTVTVHDTTPPQLTLPVPITAGATGPGGAIVTYTATAADAVDGTIAPTCTPASGATFAIGQTTVNCNAKDVAGNTSTGSFTVTVRDNTPPQLTIPTPVVASAANRDGAVVQYAASATDAVDGPVVITCSPASGATFPIGQTTVDCNAGDTAGNTGTGSFTVTVQDTTAPVVSVPTALTVSALGPAGAVATFAATATDAVDGPLTAECTPASGSTFPLGLTTVTCTARDAAGNIGSASFTVTIVDTLPPVLHVPGTIAVQATGPAGAVVQFTVTAVDAVDGAVTPVCTPASDATFPLGQTTVTCTAQDAHGNKASQSFLVTVTAAPPPPPGPDRTPPVITVPAPITARADGPPGTAVAFPATAVDAVDGTVPVTCSPASGSVFPVGATTVRCSAQDAHGNSAAKSFTVTVADKAPPPAVVGLTVQAGSGHTLLRWENPRSADLARVVLERTRLPSGPTVVLYSGKGTSFTDKHAQNGVRYRYTVFAVDAQGNRSGLAVTVEPTALVLVRPSDGARVSRPPTLLWVRAAKADYYNVQLYRNGKKVISVWPSANRFALPAKWSFGGLTHRLSPGVYRWYVWPGYGAPKSQKYGTLIGTSTFVVTK